MFKRILSIVLSLLLVAAVLPVGSAVEITEDRILRKNIEDHYVKTLEENASQSLSGLCGVLASYQLYFLGINSYPIMANGNDQYDCYMDKTYTDNGYRIELYSAEEYNLEEALNAITQDGTQNAYNILIGFHSTTTAAGTLYGHAVVIYGIVDGNVYFTESFSTAFTEREGAASVCSIAQFAGLYESWTEFEGAVHFGRNSYLENCIRRNAYMYVQVQQEDSLYTQPCVPDTEEVESHYIRTARKGERLLVTAMYENTLGRYYYQVQEGDTICYLDAQRAEPVRFNAEDVILSDPKVPLVLEPGKDFTVSGKITSRNSLVGSVTITVTDASGEIIMTHSRAKKSGTYDLQKDIFNLIMDFGILEEGVYTYTITANVVSSYLDTGLIKTGMEKATLCSETFFVGQAAQMPRQGLFELAYLEDGWTLLGDVWYYYEQGMPRTGWFCYEGVEYYLQEDGSITTGWAEINGKERYFTANGAMCTGWLHTQEGSWYLLKNGQKVMGWRDIDGKRYYFGENGLILSDGWQTMDEKTYFFFADGSVATDWVTLDDGTFYFGEDGQLLAKAKMKGDDISYEILTQEDITVPPLKIQ